MGTQHRVLATPHTRSREGGSPGPCVRRTVLGGVDVQPPPPHSVFSGKPSAGTASVWWTRLANVPTCPLGHSVLPHRCTSYRHSQLAFFHITPASCLDA